MLEHMFPNCASMNRKFPQVLSCGRVSWPRCGRKLPLQARTDILLRRFRLNYRLCSQIPFFWLTQVRKAPGGGIRSMMKPHRQDLQGMFPLLLQHSGSHETAGCSRWPCSIYPLHDKFHTAAVWRNAHSLLDSICGPCYSFSIIEKCFFGPFCGVRGFVPP